MQFLTIDSEIDGRYTLTKKLGSGAFGNVFEALDKNLDRRVAIKVHKAGSSVELARFRRESKIMTKLHHPHIVQLRDVIDHGNSSVIVMDLIEGETLRNFLFENDRLDTDSAIQIARQICDAVSYAHSNGVIHRDLKPANIIVGRNHRNELFVSVLDFGLAKSVDTATGNPAITKQGSLMGTAKYIAPELAMGESATPATDVYAIGLITLQMLTGNPVFESTDLMGVLAKHIHAPVRIPHTIAYTPIGEFIQTCTQKRPETRYTDAEQAFAFLREITGPNMLVPEDEVPHDRDRVFEITIGPLANRQGSLVNVAPEIVGGKNFEMDTIPDRDWGERSTAKLLIEKPPEHELAQKKTKRLVFKSDPNKQRPTVGAYTPLDAFHSPKPATKTPSQPTLAPKQMVALGALAGVLVLLAVLTIWMTLQDSAQSTSSENTESALQPAPETSKPKTVETVIEVEPPASTRTERVSAENSVTQKKTLDDKTEEIPTAKRVAPKVSRKKTEPKRSRTPKKLVVEPTKLEDDASNENLKIWEKKEPVEKVEEDSDGLIKWSAD